MLPRFLLPCLALSLVACSSTTPIENSSTSWNCVCTEPTNLRMQVVANCAESANDIAGRLQVEGTSGELRLRLVDPNGIERMVATGGTCDVRHRSPGVTGTWTLHVEPKDFVGSYSIELAAGGVSIPVRVEIAVDAER